MPIRLRKANTSATADSNKVDAVLPATVWRTDSKQSRARKEAVKNENLQDPSGNCPEIPLAQLAAGTLDPTGLEGTLTNP